MNALTATSQSFRCSLCLACQFACALPEDFSPTAGAKPVGDVDEVVPNMTFYAISDVHVELPQNMGHAAHTHHLRFCM
eukprot:4758157-Amphidinium_carterae.1